VQIFANGALNIVPAVNFLDEIYCFNVACIIVCVIYKYVVCDLFGGEKMMYRVLFG